MCKPQRIFSATPNSEEMELLRTLFEPQDRKSTRLNSSHGYISYAVFCLKKKNNADNKSNVQHCDLPFLKPRGPATMIDEGKTLSPPVLLSNADYEQTSPGQNHRCRLPT